MKTALLFILMMLVLVGPHEFGHMIVAKLCGVQVNEFSIGFGPIIFKKQKGETLYSIRAIPLGGFCRMEGEDVDTEDDKIEESVCEPVEKEYNPRAYNNKNNWQKVAILLAGVTMNVIIAIVVTIIAVSISGVPTSTLESVEKGSPAAIAGIEAGDKILKVDGVETEEWADVITELNKYDGKGEVEVTVERNGKQLNCQVVPEYNEEEGRYIVGIVTHSTHNLLRCIPYGLEYTWYLNKTMLYSFKLILTGGVGMDGVAGPVGLVKVVNETANYGISSYLLLLALVSLNLAFINLLPIPGLDGGKILFIILKVISFGKITDEMEMKATVAGAIVLFGLFIVMTVNDISNLFG